MANLRFGIYTPNYGNAISARGLAELASEAEAAGWSGFFIWDHILAGKTLKVPMVDPWVALAAVAMTTSHIVMGTTVTPVARRRPWKLARETATLDHLSGGRLILSVGLGEPADVEFLHFGEEPDAKIRAEKLDEGLEILTGLWSGKNFQFSGKHFQVDKCRFQPATLQQPRIPVWVGGFWPNKAPFRRAARFDGAFPLKKGGLKPKDLADLRAFIDTERQIKSPYELVMVGRTPGENAEKAGLIVKPYADAGLTWWLENMYLKRNDFQALRKRIRLGPPALL